MGAQIRRMNTGDIAAVQAVARTTWARTYQGIIPEDAQEAFLSHAYSTESSKRRIEQGIFFVAEQDGRIVGFANFVKAPESGDDTVELAAIYVLPEQQGQGVGTGLLTAGIRAVPGVSRVTVRVNRDNQAGRRFYEARGFRFDRDLVETFFGHEQHLVEMVLQVSR